MCVLQSSVEIIITAFRIEWNVQAFEPVVDLSLITSNVLWLVPASIPPSGMTGCENPPREHIDVHSPKTLEENGAVFTRAVFGVCSINRASAIFDLLRQLGETFLLLCFLFLPL